MYQRIINILKSNSFFLFGARGTGKSSLLREEWAGQDVLWIDLLDPDLEERYIHAPGRLSEELTQRKSLPEWVIIDEVQKAPKLLDVVHSEIESRHIKFALTGSSARKLKRGGANLLAGRAFLNHLYPMTFIELGEDFDLQQTLRWGSLPKILDYTTDLERSEFLKSYVQVYLKEEIFQEQLVRSTVPFRKFLPIAAQMNGKILNFNAIAKDLQVDWTTVRSYFEILEDTWLGFSLPAFSRSLRKQQLKSPKFYLFDIGVQRALDHSLMVLPSSGQVIGPLFEHFIILEVYRLNHYMRRDYTLSFLTTQGGLEIDLIIERPGLKTILVEIKSSSHVRDDHLRHIEVIATEFPEFEAICLCQESQARKVGKVSVLPWRQGIAEIGLI